MATKQMTTDIETGFVQAWRIGVVQPKRKWNKGKDVRIDMELER